MLTAADRSRQSADGMRIESKFLPGPDSDIAAVIDYSQIDEPLQSIYLLYAQSELTAGPSRQFPPWYTLGIAYLTNGLLVREDGSALFNRELPFQPDVKGKHPQIRYDLTRLLQTTPGDLVAGADIQEYVRSAHDWALYGLLTTPERRMHYRDLAVL